MPIPGSRGIEMKSQQPKMIKSLSALSIFLLLGAAVIAVPGFAPKVEAGEAGALVKGDRLEVRATASNCSTQVWPNYAATCLHNPASQTTVVEARLVTARR
jgi:hypothetical protein